MSTAAPGAAWSIVPIKGPSPSPSSGQSVVLTLDVAFDGDPKTSLPQLTADCVGSSWRIDVDFSPLNKTQKTGNLNIKVAGYGAANSDEEIYKGDDYTFQIPMEVQGPVTHIT